MFGTLGDIAGLFKQASQMKERMRTLQEELAKRTHEADAGAGDVTVRVNGRGEVLAVKIRPEAVNPGDIETLEELVRAAVNAAVKKSQEAAQAEMAQITAGLNLPGLNAMLGRKS